jgi:hypothetical protein
VFFVAGVSGSSGSNPYNVGVQSGQFAQGIVFDCSGSATVSGSGSVFLGNGGITVPQYAYSSTPQAGVTISSQLILQAAQTWSNSSANALTISGNVVNDGNTLTLAGPAKLSFPVNWSESAG